MAYLALARKWRPKAFSEVVGQQHVVQALSNALDSGRVHHAFLFTGTRGVGKTTLARIFAKSLNCEQGTSAEPCQVCGTCQSIDEGRFVDLIEVDAASRTKVDETRELLENIHYAPTSGKYKVYLIDEVHMLSGHSFNAMLKTLEEPPEHVKFLFATTDPQKLPVTILSRCLQFNLRAMRPEQVENQIVKILGLESIEFDSDAVQALAKAADGSMRDGLSLLDQAIAQGGGEVRSQDVLKMLGTIKTEHINALLESLLSRDVSLALKTVADMSDHAVDFSGALDELLMLLYHISLYQLSPSALDGSNKSDDGIPDAAAKLSPEAVQLFYQIGLLGKRDLSLAPNLRVGFEMVLLRMFAFEPADIEQSSIPSFNSNQPKTLETEAVPAEKKTPEIGHSPAQDTSPIEQENTQGQGAAIPQKRIIQDQSIPSSVRSSGDSSTSTTDLSSADASQVPSNRPASQSSPDMIPPWESVPHEHVDEGANGVAKQEPATEPVSLTNSAAPIEHEHRPADTVRDDVQPVAKGPSPVAVTLAGNNEWGELIEQTTLVGMAKELAMNCSADRMSEDRIDLCLSPKLEHLHNPQRFEEIKAAVLAVTNPNILVSLEIDDSNRETPSECLSRLGFERHEQVKDAIYNDPGVKSLISEFGATIKDTSIKPL